TLSIVCNRRLDTKPHKILPLRFAPKAKRQTWQGISDFGQFLLELHESLFVRVQLLGQLVGLQWRKDRDTAYPCLNGDAQISRHNPGFVIWMLLFPDNAASNHPVVSEFRSQFVCPKIEVRIFCKKFESDTISNHICIYAGKPGMEARDDFLSSFSELVLGMSDFVVIQLSNDCWAQNNDDLAGLRESEPINLLKSAIMQQHIGVDKQVGHSTN